MAFCALTGTVKDPTGALLLNRKFTFRKSLSITAETGVVVLDDVVTATTNGSGAISISLASGTYQMTAVGSVNLARELIVPDLASADIAALLATPGGSYELISWATYQAAVAASGLPYATIAAGIGGVADGALFFVTLNSTIGLYRRSGAGAVQVWVSL